MCRLSNDHCKLLGKQPSTPDAWHFLIQSVLDFFVFMPARRPQSDVSAGREMVIEGRMGDADTCGQPFHCQCMVAQLDDECER